MSELFERLPTETRQAYRAFALYRNLGQKRTLATVSRMLALENQASGLRIVADDASTRGAQTGPPKRAKKSGRIGLWSRQFRWLERAAAWDRVLDAHLRQKQLSAIEEMAARHAAQAELAAEHLMKPVLAFARAMEDPVRAASFENLTMPQLFELCLSACSLLPRLQAAERLARGCRVVTNAAMAAPGSPQGPAEWRVSIYAPPREQPAPDPTNIAQMADEWEEAVTPN